MHILYTLVYTSFYSTFYRLNFLALVSRLTASVYSYIVLAQYSQVSIHVAYVDLLSSSEDMSSEKFNQLLFKSKKKSSLQIFPIFFFNFFFNLPTIYLFCNFYWWKIKQ